MEIKQTSIDAYHKLDPDKVQSQKDKITKYLQDNAPNSFSLRQISQETKLPLNVVWSRTNTLNKKGIVIQGQNAVDGQTGMEVQTWKVKL